MELMWEVQDQGRRRNWIKEQDRRFQAAWQAASVPAPATKKPAAPPSEPSANDDADDPILPSPFAWKAIVREVAGKHNLTTVEMLAHRRSMQIVHARHEAFYRLSKETTMSMPEIGRRLGNFDASTVWHGIETHKKRMLEAQQ